MKNNLLDPVRVPPGVTRVPFWNIRRKRIATLLFLATGLILLLVSLSGEARASLWVALGIQRGLIGLLLVFALVTISLIWSAGQRLDTWVFTFLNMRGYPRWLDRFMWLATQLGNMLTAFIVGFLLFILNYRRLSIEVVFGTITLWLVVESIKWLVDRARPFHALDKTRIIGWRESGVSFPSGHTTQIFFLMTLFTRYFQMGMVASIILYSIAAFVGFTRIYVGAHYPRDVIAGVVLGSAWGILATLVDSYWLVLHF